MAADDLHAELDWSGARVRGGRLTVGYDAQPAREWSDRVQTVLDRLDRSGAIKVSVQAVRDRLDRPGARWGTIKVTRKRVRVTCVEPGCEDDLRQLLEDAVRQANADLAPDGADKRRSDADERMTAVFRSLAPGA